MNLLRPLFIGLCCITAATAAAQSFMEQPDFIRANSIWNFGEGGGLDFNAGPPVAIPTPGYAPFFGTATLASPQTGALLLYTDGINCYNKNHAIMLNGADLVPGPFPSVGNHGVCIVPFIDDPDKYYIFHTESVHRESASAIPDAGFMSFNLYYSVVDLSLDGGNGAVVAGSKGIFIDSILTQSIIAVPGDHCDIWLLGHSMSDPNFFYSPYFKAFHITSTGLDPTPVVSTITGSRIATSSPPPPLTIGLPMPQAYESCHMAVSPDRKMIAVAVANGDFGSLYPDGPLGPVTNYNFPPMDMNSKNPGTTIAQHAAGLLAYKFDPATGVVSNEIFVRNLGSANNVAFSPDNSKLYVNLIGPVNQMAPVSYICGSTISQYDMSLWDSAAIVNSKYDVYKTDSLYSFESFFLRTFKDKVYFQRYDDAYHLGVINNPDIAGSGAVYVDSFLAYSGGSGNFGNFPNQVVFPIKERVSTRRDTLICGSFTAITLQAPPGGSDYTWDDGSTAATRSITAAGTYWVRYTSAAPCTYYVDTINVKANPAGIARIGYDPDDCDGSVTLISHTTADSYLWSTGATQRAIEIQASGKYWLRTNNDGCYASDTVQVDLCHCHLNIPTAFSPNSDGLNDDFVPVFSAGCRSVKPYTLSVYNRYGERVFQSIDPLKGWNGKYADGAYADAGVYFYRVDYQVGSNKKELHQKGDITLIR